jgi:hypothetical protein
VFTWFRLSGGLRRWWGHVGLEVRLELDSICMQSHKAHINSLWAPELKHTYSHEWIQMKMFPFAALRKVDKYLRCTFRQSRNPVFSSTSGSSSCTTAAALPLPRPFLRGSSSHSHRAPPVQSQALQSYIQDGIDERYGQFDETAREQQTGEVTDGMEQTSSIKVLRWHAGVACPPRVLRAVRVIAATFCGWCRELEPGPPPPRSSTERCAL